MPRLSITDQWLLVNMTIKTIQRLVIWYLVWKYFSCASIFQSWSRMYIGRSRLSINKSSCTPPNW